MQEPTLAFRLMVSILSLVVWIPTSMADGDQTLATIDGQPITENEVVQAGAWQFARLESEHARKRHDLLESQLDAVIWERLVVAEAKARNISREQLLASIATEVTDAEVEAYYETNKARISTAKEIVIPQIKAYLVKNREKTDRDRFFKELEAKYKVDVKLEPIRETVAAVGPTKGPANAPVTIVEFSDFQCPYCARILPTLEQVEAKYGDKVRLVFRQFPLSIHPQAPKAAEASLCALEQGKFWELHDAMFKNQAKLAVDDLKATASTLHLDTEEFTTCLDSAKYASQVTADMTAGETAGVNGTPALFINGRIITGAVPVDQITTVIDDELRRGGAKVPAAN